MGAQLQNLPSRGGLGWKDAEAVINLVLETEDPEWAADRIELLHGEVPTAMSSCLRGVIQAPPGKQLFVADYSNIEGRVAAWLGNEAWKLQAFRAFDAGVGPDLYKVTAGGILGKSPEQVDGTERNIMGKVPELALGFGGGVGAFQSMAKNFNVQMADYWDIIQASLDEVFVQKAFDNWDRFGKKSGLDQPEWLRRRRSRSVGGPATRVSSAAGTTLRTPPAKPLKPPASGSSSQTASVPTALKSMAA